jgi:hypothetical protein
MAKIAPLRASELVTTMDAITAEWIDAELVVRYIQSDGQAVLWFPGFQKNQRMASFYSREAPSLYDPPPGWARGPEGLIPLGAQPESVPVATPTAPDAPNTAAALVPEQIASDSRVSHELVASDSRADHELLATNSRVTPTLKQQRNQESKNQTPHANSSSSNKRARARADPPRAAAGEVKPEIYSLLAEFGVSEPARSEIARNGAEAADVRDWIDYLRTQQAMRNPQGYLVKRLRGHDPPPRSQPKNDESYEALKRRYIPADWEEIIHY